MFEKEAEERSKREYASTAPDLQEAYADGFKDGAEYGYNKANEWHYPSKGELPEEGDEVLCFFEDEMAETAVYTNHFVFSRFVSADVIAWRYLPEPPKEVENAGFYTRRKREDC